MEVPENLLEFIEKHQYEDISSIILKYGKETEGISIEEAVRQINSRKKAKNKIPSFIKEGLLFPDSISAEQASDERVAKYHARLVGNHKEVIDMTAGLGIDAMTIGLAGNKVVAIEMDANKAEYLKHNADVCGVKDFKVTCGNSVEYISSLSSFSSQPRIIFIDPARRSDDRKRVFLLKDCLPDITQFYKSLLDKGCRLMIKLSPLLDLTSLTRQLENISEIHIVSVKGECKEILLILQNNTDSSALPISVNAVDLNEEGEVNFQFQTDWDEIEKCLTTKIGHDYDFTDKWLYEPGASVMKINSSGILCHAFPGLNKVADNTSLFVSDAFYPDFPGRKLKITRIFSKKDFASLKGEPRNVTVRNYPLPAEELRKKLKTREGNDIFIYGFRSGPHNHPLLLECTRHK